MIISSFPLPPSPGNEKLVGKVVNELMKSGAEVIYERMYDVHVSGHACQDETRTLLALTRPRFFMPVHGEYKHLVKNAQVARSMGYDEKNIIISDIGKVVETDGVDMKITGNGPLRPCAGGWTGRGRRWRIVLRDRKPPFGGWFGRGGGIHRRRHQERSWPDRTWFPEALFMSGRRRT